MDTYLYMMIMKWDAVNPSATILQETTRIPFY